MRRYAAPVDVVRGHVDGVEGPAQFVWRARPWRVCAIVATWVETGSWWEHDGIHGLLGVGEGEAETAVTSVAALLGEREMWRVEASRGRLGARAVVDLSFDWASGDWRLVRCLD